ncbi:helix-turn-helix domain-containing protein [Actinophytocola sp. NPDC049390]|uniref:helix-turn-helix domain-containing protein n=1 Tax=Actinophytocola sp. NPDC049390 TaxID=3363894 RepID=UPI0037A2C6FB
MEEQRKITDPKALRALAHPVRWKLLEIIGREGTATATQCAQETGESVANCSYHLNLLAKYRYVEKAEGGQGREKPWRLLSQSQSISSIGMDADGVLAVQAASGAFLDHALTQIRERHLTSHLESEEWGEVIGVDNANEFMTVDEVVEVHRVVRALMDKYKERRTRPELRPEGARAVNLFFSVTVAPQKD